MKHRNLMYSISAYQFFSTSSFKKSVAFIVVQHNVQVTIINIHDIQALDRNEYNGADETSSVIIILTFFLSSLLSMCSLLWRFF